MTVQVVLRRTSLIPPADERSAEGKAIRERIPRSCHAAWTAPGERADPIALLRHTDRDRLKRLIPIRYGRMLASPSAFLRGAAVVMAHDLAPTPVTGLRAWICGDAHLGNFGGFATPERHLIFDLNDFDEALDGPWEWDVKRLAASVVVAGRGNGLSDAECRDAAEACVRSYRQRVRQLAAMGFLDAWYSRLDAADAFARFDDNGVAERAIAEAHRRTNPGTLPKLAEETGDGYRIADDAPLVTHHTQSLGNRLPAAWSVYQASLAADRRVLLARYRLVDVARKVVGVGSVGLRCFVALLLGNDDDDPLFLQIKEARASVLEPFLAKRPYGNHGKRVVSGQRIMQAASDLFLGWTHAGRVDYYVRQLRDMKFGVSTDELDADDLVAYGGLCGWSLARAHACSGDPARIGGYLGPGDAFDRAVAAFAVAYADQTERDHATLVAAAKRGRVPAERGV
ncbi:MAG TPA: DUF2252 domain-containing protein [Thermomicrobiales bacterium]|jgi:uncharacterized protein (DUF2252 family)